MTTSASSGVVSMAAAPNMAATLPGMYLHGNLDTWAAHAQYAPPNVPPYFNMAAAGGKGGEQRKPQHAGENRHLSGAKTNAPRLSSGVSQF